MKRLLPLALLLFVHCGAPVEPPVPVGHGAARERWLFRQRAYPFDTIPADGRRSALAGVRRGERLQAHASLPAVSWRAIGPLPVHTAWPWKSATGRVKTLAVSPQNAQIVLAGSSSGGIWRSTDGGTTFAPVTDTHADLSIGAIAFAPSNPQIVYAASGSDFLGTGVLRSTDAGATWQVVSGPTFAPRGTANRMVVDPADPDRLWVAQTSQQSAADGKVYSSGLLRSDDGGFRWRTVFRGIITDFTTAPTSPSTFFLGVARHDDGGSAGLYRSLDSGTTWSLVHTSPMPFPRYEVAVSPLFAGRVYMHAWDGLKLSLDGGTTWSGVPAIDLPHDSPTFLETHPGNDLRLFAGFGGGDLYTSSDGGLSWLNRTRNISESGGFQPDKSTAHIDQHAIAFSPADPRVLYLGNDGGIFRSADFGMTFTSLAGSLSLVQAYRITAHPLDPSLLFLGTQDNGIERRDANGWTELFTGDYGSVLFDPGNPRHFLTNYIHGTIYRFAENGDVVVERVTTNATFGEGSSSQRIGFIAPFEQCKRTNALYFGSWRLYRSTDFGAQWLPRSQVDLTRGGSDAISAIAVSEADPNVLYTGSEQGRVMVTRDSGMTWNDVTGQLPRRWVRAIAADRMDSARAWIAFSGYRSLHVYRTHDHGATWQPASDGLPDVPVNALLIDPANRDVVYAGTDIGVFRLDGAQWRFIGNGMPPVVVTSFDVTASGRIVASTYGRGAYELVTAGSSRRRGVRH